MYRNLCISKSGNTCIFFIVILLVFHSNACKGTIYEMKTAAKDTVKMQTIIVGAERMEEYLPYIKNKKVALVVNHTSFVKGSHLVDTLSRMGIDIAKVFAPEHGFRGQASAGETINNETDERTGISIISLYGNKKKPSNEDLKGVEVIIFDIQDVGVRFYTYISTLELVMEAAAGQGIEFILLDRPNPHINYIGGPVLEQGFKSFIGQQSIPVVYGLSIGEYGAMLKGEGLFFNAEKLNMQIIYCKNYTRQTYYELPIPPSPNLPNMTSVLLYPLLCLLEGTDFSEGRGTEFPFQQYGHPSYKNKQYAFIPQELAHAKKPKWLNEKCYGVNLSNIDPVNLFENPSFHLDYILDAFKNTGLPSAFFKNYSFFDKLAGTDQVRKDITAGLSAAEIMAKWKPGLVKFTEISRKYRYYPEH